MLIVKCCMTNFPLFAVLALSILANDASLVIPISTGAHTEGGIDGAVLRVTTLAAKGPGSLCEALETDGARLVVFEVGGVIDLGGRSLSVKHPYLTIAGQTAPDPGITLIRGGLVIETHDVVVQHIAVRPGDDGPKPWAPDAISVTRGSNVVIEHCSATWAIDENLSTSGPGDVEDSRLTAPDITLRSCLVAGAERDGKVFLEGVDREGSVAMRGNLLCGVAEADDGVVRASGGPAGGDAGANATRALRYAGARAARRDPIDARIVQSIIRGDGHIIDSQNEVGGYPKREATKRALVVPKDRRAWLAKLSKELREDRQLDVAPLWKRLGRPSS